MSAYHPENPLIVQGDHTVLAEVDGPRYIKARDHLARFAELVKSPEHIHTYRISPLSLWNAASAGVDADAVLKTLTSYSRYDVPENVIVGIREMIARFGLLRLRPGQGDTFTLEILDSAITEELRATPAVARLLTDSGEDEFEVQLIDRGTLKQELGAIGYPLQDLVPLRGGQPLPLTLRERALAGLEFAPRDYKHEAARRF
jgi:DNA excision repair protein ERCC-3